MFPPPSEINPLVAWLGQGIAKLQGFTSTACHIARQRGGSSIQSIPLRSPSDATQLARDLKKDLSHLHNRDVDPAAFIGGVLARIASRVEPCVSC